MIAPMNLDVRLRAPIGMLIERVTAVVEGILRENVDLVSRLVSERKRFENWLQLEALRRLMEEGVDLEIEWPFPSSKDRCDFWASDSSGLEHWIELKLCVTNYCAAYTSSKLARPITNQVSDILRDVAKLQRINKKNQRNVLLVAYPLPESDTEHVAWRSHLKKIEEEVQRLTKAFSMVVKHGAETAQVSTYVLTV